MRFCPQCATPLESREIDGVVRRACPAAGCGFVHWDNPVPVVAALVFHGDEVLLARNAGWPEGRFSLISGFLERGESPEQAVVRELKEELGLDGCAVEFIGHYPLFERNQLILAYAVEARGTVALGPEIVEVRQIARERLSPDLFGPLHLAAAVVREWLARGHRTPEH